MINDFQVIWTGFGLSGTGSEGQRREISGRGTLPSWALLLEAVLQAALYGTVAAFHMIS